MTWKRVLGLALLVWLLRWGAGELAAYAGRHWRRPGLSPLEARGEGGGLRAVTRSSDPKG